MACNGGSLGSPAGKGDELSAGKIPPVLRDQRTPVAERNRYRGCEGLLEGKSEWQREAVVSLGGDFSDRVAIWRRQWEVVVANKVSGVMIWNSKRMEFSKTKLGAYHIEDDRGNGKEVMFRRQGL